MSIFTKKTVTRSPIKVLLQRFSQESVTFGKLHIEGLQHPDIYTIELPWQNNKVGVSCIPQGLYNCEPHNTKSYPDTWRILCVPGRTGILLHVGNYASDGILPSGKPFKSNTKGCILPGFGIDEDIPMVQRSGAAMEYLRNTIGVNNNFSLEVKNC